MQQNKKRLIQEQIARQRNTGYLNGYTGAIKRLQQRQRKLTILTLSMTLSFYISWTPYAICSLLRVLGVLQEPPLSNVIGILLTKTETIVNPIIYIFFNKEVSTISIFNTLPLILLHYAHVIIFKYIVCNVCNVLF